MDHLKSIKNWLVKKFIAFLNHIWYIYILYVINIYIYIYIDKYNGLIKYDIILMQVK